MKNITYLMVFIFLTVMSSCKNSSENNTGNTETAQEKKRSESLPEMSIYHLPSHWTNQNGETVELKDLQGKVVVMVMIYTTCKAACPRLVADMRNIEKQIPEDKKENVLYVFVSIDPETDTPEKLKVFAKENQMDNEKWLFLRGTENDTREFAAVLAVNYKEISPMDFSHSNIISVFDQQGEMVHQQEGLGVDNVETVEAIIKMADKG
ncbi:SCO family protein [Aequorivita sp. SDUM287046]|uniref:SCO family protein n=1 Tax=Aequorivita aurantiaca TaxID=3053356 RepID=A0ABT8DH38_9FLAO|nr:SCO family protein [Aequorivita aurantiaca]MDN3724167.1 SCO family protein [Aequorivita aurantiaca]